VLVNAAKALTDRPKSPSLGTRWRQPRAGENPFAMTEALWDASTRALIRALAVGQGSRCFEVGAGGGSIAKWLGNRVGLTGLVVATDLHPCSIDRIGCKSNVSVREYDVASSDPPEHDFDFALARLVVAYVGAQAIPRIAKVLRPGGTLLIEDYDWRQFHASPTAPAVQQAIELVLALMKTVGLDPSFGAELANHMNAARLAEVGTKSRTRRFRGGTPHAEFVRRVIDVPSTHLVGTGLLTPRDLASAHRELSDPSTTFVGPALVASWGTAP
jgi:SAM-dependent methyltransferase